MNDNIFEIFLEKAGSIPGIRIERDVYLKKAFEKEYKKRIKDIIVKGPIKAGIDLKEVSRIADQAILSETMTTVGVSVGTGAIGGPIALAAIPADILQFYGHLLRVVQKLMYLYGWEENVFEPDGDIDDTTSNFLVLCFGIMLGVEIAGQVASQIAMHAAKKALIHVPKHVLKALITKQAFREMVKKIVKAIGVKTTVKYSFAIGTKIVPVFGGVASGALTAIFFVPMSKRMKRYFAKNATDYS